MIFVDARNCFLKRKFVRFVCFRTLSGRGQTHFKPAPPKKNKGAKKIRQIDRQIKLKTKARKNNPAEFSELDRQFQQTEIKPNH